MFPSISISEDKNNRFYSDSQRNLTDGVSVTTVLKAYRNPDLTSWYRKLGEEESKKNGSIFDSDLEILEKGKIEGDKIRDACQVRGNIFHKEIEDYYLGKKETPSLDKKQFTTFVTDCIIPKTIDDTCTVEIPLVGYSSDKKNIYGGTVDFYGEPKISFKNFKTKDTLDIGNFVLDWKNTYSVKNPVSFNTGTKSKYYPLTDYFLQTAAYTAAFNQFFGDRIEHKIKDNLVVVNPWKSKKVIYIYHCNSEKVKFYWQKFQELLECYYSKKETFNWCQLEAEIGYYDMIPKRITYDL